MSCQLHLHTPMRADDAQKFVGLLPGVMLGEAAAHCRIEAYFRARRQQNCGWTLATVLPRVGHFRVGTGPAQRRARWRRSLILIPSFWQ